MNIQRGYMDPESWVKRIYNTTGNYLQIYQLSSNLSIKVLE